MSIQVYKLLADSHVTAKAAAFNLMTEHEERYDGNLEIVLRVPKTSAEMGRSTDPSHWVNITVPYGNILWDAVVEGLAESIDETLESIHSELTKGSES